MEEGEAKAKKKEASVFSGREEDIDKGLFGEGVSTRPGPEDIITQVDKTKAYTGQLCGLLVVELKAYAAWLLLQQVNPSLMRVSKAGNQPK